MKWRRNWRTISWKCTQSDSSSSQSVPSAAQTELQASDCSFPTLHQMQSPNQSRQLERLFRRNSDDFLSRFWIEPAQTRAPCARRTCRTAGKADFALQTLKPRESFSDDSALRFFFCRRRAGRLQYRTPAWFLELWAVIEVVPCKSKVKSRWTWSL